jgi:hypothetical protein
MIILISAFVWRTVTYKSKTTVQRRVCNLNTGNCFLNINNKKIIVSLSQTKPQANTLVELYINPVDINPSASVSGVAMNIGVLPIIFTQQKDGWVGKFTVPQSTHNKMIWNIDIKINQNIYSSEFTVTK